MGSPFPDGIPPKGDGEESGAEIAILRMLKRNEIVV